MRIELIQMVLQPVKKSPDFRIFVAKHLYWVAATLTAANVKICIS